MQINISARHGHLSTATQEKMTEKVRKLPRLFDRISAIQITADVADESSPSVELQVSIEHAEDLVAVETASSLMAALDGALHKLEKQVRKHKERMTEHRATGHKRLETPTETDTDSE